jgi:hypothetical protein
MKGSKIKLILSKVRDALGLIVNSVFRDSCKSSTNISLYDSQFTLHGEIFRAICGMSQIHMDVGRSDIGGLVDGEDR